MAKYDLKFLDVERENNNISVKLFDEKQIEICITAVGLQRSYIYLDKSTAIKFSKTLRTEINKISEND